MTTNPDSLLSCPWGAGLCALLEIALVIGVFVLCLRTELVRDSDPALPNFRDRPYSLAKSQLAFWMVVVVGSFVWVFFAKEAYSGLLNNTVLWLLGISSGTAALSAAAGGAPPAGAGVAPPSQRHQSFLGDVLSDNQGMNIHRLQMLIWTAVFGGIFVYETLTTGKFPAFDDQAFVLMGISSVTYVWFKRTEV